MLDTLGNLKRSNYCGELRASDADIMLGIMASMGGRTEQRAKTDAQGHYVFSGLNTGSQQAYRVNVLRDGAKFSTTPFRLPDEMGYHARVAVRGVTQDQRMLFQVIGQTVIELRDDRLHITQQARLANAGDKVITFPKDGLVVPLLQAVEGGVTARGGAEWLVLTTPVPVQVARSRAGSAPIDCA